MSGLWSKQSPNSFHKDSERSEKLEKEWYNSVLNFITGRVLIPQEKKEVALNLIQEFLKAESKRIFVPCKMVAKKT